MRTTSGIARVRARACARALLAHARNSCNAHEQYAAGRRPVSRRVNRWKFCADADADLWRESKCCEEVNQNTSNSHETTQVKTVLIKGKDKIVDSNVHNATKTQNNRNHGPKAAMMLNSIMF